MKERGLILNQLDGNRILIRGSDILRISENINGTCIIFQDGSSCQVENEFDDVMEEVGRITQ